MDRYVWVFIAFCALCLLALMVGLMEAAHRQSEEERREDARRAWQEDVESHLRETEERERIKALLKGEE